MKKSNKGFTLVELIIVIAILAIIMLIAIPNFSGIQQRMKVRADKATAAQIGKAVRVWYTDYTSDPVMKKTIDDASGVILDTDYKIYDTIANIEGYAAKTYLPTSLTDGSVTVEHQAYAVKLSSSTQDAKVVVAICKSEQTTTEDGEPYDKVSGRITDTDPITVNYDGKAPAVAYVEP